MRRDELIAIHDCPVHTARVRGLVALLAARLPPPVNHETKSWIKNDSDFDALRAHPRYQRILELTR